MSEYALDLWRRALKAVETAQKTHEQAADYDAAASRAYYAAFYAVSALLAIEGKSFTKHSAVEASVHRELVRTGRCTVDLGSDYRALHSLRNTGDYGGLEHVTEEQALNAVRAAEKIIRAVKGSCPEFAGIQP